MRDFGVLEQEQSRPFRGVDGPQPHAELADAFCLRGLELIGGVLNVTDRGFSTAAEDFDESDFPFAAAQGRTLFLNARYTFGS